MCNCRFADSSFFCKKNDKTMKKVTVLIGTGSIGMAIVRRVGDLAEFLMSSRGRFITGTDILIDGGTTASYWYGDLQYLKATH